MLQIQKVDKSESPTVQVTERAATKVLALMAAEGKEGYGLRVSISGGGCSGFQYGLTWENKEQSDDQILEYHGLKVYVDTMSGKYLQGATVDYIDTLQGAGFKIDNPNSTGSCGCGESFSV